MDFFQHQDRARRSTKWLVFFYLCALVCIAVAIYLPIAFVILVNAAGPEEDFPSQLTPELISNLLLAFAATIGIVVLVIGGGTLWKVSELAAGGGRVVAEMLGGRAVSPNTSDPQERKLLNVVEEMAIASGLVVPTVYVMDHEDSINAFAAGYTPNEAVVAVTRGTMNLLDRDELQGVIAHEFSHILNGDMRLNIKLIGTLFGLELLVLIGWYMMRLTMYSGNSRSSNNDNKGGGLVLAIMLVGILTVIVGSIGMFFSAVIKAAISRQREFLADASAVQFTRNPAGIAGALKKIGSPNVGSAVADPHAVEVSHMFFGNAFSAGLLQSLFATHPPLADRIKRIDPSFDGKFPARITPPPVNAPDVKRPASPGMPFPLPVPMPGSANVSGVAAISAALIDQVGRLDRGTVDRTANTLKKIPENLLEAVREPEGALAVVAAIMLDDEVASRTKQLALLQRQLPGPIFAQVNRYEATMATLPAEAKIPLVQKSFPALRLLDKEQYRFVRDLLDTMIKADGRMSLFEYTIKGMLFHDLDVYFGFARAESVRYTSTASVKQQLIYVLSFLAYSGHTELGTARKAFAAGMKSLGIAAEPTDPKQCRLEGFDQALRTLIAAAPAVKKSLLEAILHCIADDGSITAREAELVRAVCAMLGIPMPPIEAGA